MAEDWRNWPIVEEDPISTNDDWRTWPVVGDQEVPVGDDIPDASLQGTGWIGRPLTQDISTLRDGQKYLDLVEQNQTGRRGILEELFDPEAKDIAFVGGFAEIPYTLGMAKTAKKLNDNEPVTDQELLDLNYYMEYQKRKENQTFGAKVVDTVQGAISYGLEIAASFVLAGLLAPEPVTTAAGLGISAQTTAKVAAGKEARKWLTRLVYRGLGKNAAKITGKLSKAAARGFVLPQAVGEAVEKGTASALTKRFGAKVAGRVAKVAAVGAQLESYALTQQLLNPSRTIQSFAERRLRNEIAQGDETVNASIAKAFMDMNIEYASEFSGAMIGRAAGRLLPAGLKETLGKSTIYGWISGKNGTDSTKAAWNALRTMGIGNVVEEMSEERAGDFMRGLFGVEGKAGLGNAIRRLWPGMEQIGVEAVAFSVLPLMASGIARIEGGATSTEIMRNTELVKNLVEKNPDKVVETEAEVGTIVEQLISKMGPESDPWYKDTPLRWLSNVFGDTRRGSLRDILPNAFTANVRNAYNRARDLEPDNPTAGRDAVAEIFQTLRGIQSKGIASEEDVKAFNAGVESGDIIVKESKKSRKFFIKQESLSKPEVAELREKTNIPPLISIDAKDEDSRIGEVIATDFTAPWENLTTDQKNDLKLRWNSSNIGHIKDRYNMFRKILANPNIGAKIYETLPVAYIGTDTQFNKETGYQVPSSTKPYDKNEAGENRYVMFLGAMTNEEGTEIDISTAANELSVVEDLIEAKMKQNTGGMTLTPDIDAWVSGYRKDLLAKKRRTKREEAHLRMLGSAQGRFEFAVKTFMLTNLGYDQHKDIDSHSKQLTGIEIPAEVHTDFVTVVGETMLKSLSQIELPEREIGPGEARVRELVAERGAGRTAAARAIVSEAQQNALINRLGEALKQDMRKTENKQAVQDALDAIEKSGTTFSLVEGMQAQNEFNDLKRAVQENTVEAINRAAKHWLLKVPGRPSPRVPERQEGRQINIPRGREVAGLETRTPEGGSIRRDREIEYPTPEEFKAVYSAEEILTVAPQWLLEADAIAKDENVPSPLETWLDEFTDANYDQIITEATNLLGDEAPDPNTMFNDLNIAPSRLLSSIPRLQPGRRPEARTVEVRGRTRLAARASSALPFEPVQESLFNLNEETVSAEEAEVIDENFGPEDATPDQVPTTEVFGKSAQDIALQGQPRAFWEMAPLNNQALSQQVTALVPVGMAGMSRYARQLADRMPNAEYMDAVFIPSRQKYDSTEAWVRDVSKNQLRWNIDFVPHLNKGMRAIESEEANVEGAVLVLDFSENSLENRLGLPMQRIMHDALKGAYPLGKAFQTWRRLRKGEATQLEREMDVDEILGEIEESPVVTDFLQRSQPAAFRAAVFPISTQRLESIATPEQANQLANEIHDWMVRNRIRRLMIGGLDQIETVGEHEVQTEAGDTLLFADEKVIQPAWMPNFARVMNAAMAIETRRRRQDAPEAQPTELDADTIAGLEETLREGRGTFALTTPPGTLNRRIFDAVRRFNNNRRLSDAETRNFTDMISRALAGDQAARRQLWRNLTAADRAAFGNLLRPDPTAPATFALEEGEAAPLRDFSDDTRGEVQSMNFSSELDLQEQQDQDTVVLESIDDIFAEYDYFFNTGPAAFHKKLLEINRNIRASRFRETAFIDKMKEDLGIETKREDLPEGHEDRANTFLIGVGAALDGSKRIPIKLDETTGDVIWLRDSAGKLVKPSDLLEAWDDYLTASNLDMPRSAQVLKDMRERFDQAREEANKVMNEFTDNEWINYVENYVTHQYAFKNRKEQEDTVRRIAEGTGREKKRRIPTYEEAAEIYKRVPRTLNGLNLYKSWNNTVWSAARNKGLVSAAATTRDIDGAPIVIPVKRGEPVAGENQLIDDVVLEENARSLASYLDVPYNSSANPRSEINRLLEDMNPESEGYVTMESPLTKSVDYFLVRKGVTENLMKNVLHYGRIDNKGMRFIEHYNAWSKFMMLSFSGFHPFALLESLVATFGVNMTNPVLRPGTTVKSITSLVDDMKRNPERFTPWVEAGLMADIGNPDVNLGLIEQDIQHWMDWAEGKPAYISKPMEIGLNQMQKYKGFIDKWLWHRFHPGIKFHAAEGVMNEWDNEHPDATEEERTATRQQIAAYINDAFGGQEWDQYIWATPQARQILHALVFAPDWSLSAANVSGLTRAPILKNMHATNLSPLARDQMMRKYWPAMVSIVLFGLPNLIQALVYGVAGDPDEEDVPFTFMNEAGRRTHIDFTPLWRRLPGYDGGDTGKRRLYMRWGKQAYEIFEGWLGDPRMLLRKSSSAVRTAFEQVTGSTVSGWDLPFQDNGFLGTIAVDGAFKGSRAHQIVKKFLPISVTSLADGNPTAFIAPTAKGVTPGAVSWTMAKTLDAYVNRTSLPKGLRSVDLESIVVETIEAARRNGVDPDIAFKRAKGTVVSKYYKKFFDALNKGNERAMEDAAEKVLLLGKGLRDFDRSLKARYEAVGREYTPELARAVRDAVSSAQGD